MLQAKTTEQKNHILEILGTIEPVSHFPLNYERETDVGYMEYDDRIYFDGNIGFDKMAEIVDYLRIQNGKSLEKQRKDMDLSHINYEVVKQKEAIKRASKLLQMAFGDANEENLAIIKVAEKEKDVDFFACALDQLEKTCIELRKCLE